MSVDKLTEELEAKRAEIENFQYDASTRGSMRNSLSMSADEVLAEYEKNREFYSKGGTTVTGGEPLMQGKFLIEAMAALKEKGIQSALDISGTYVDEYTRDALAACDLVLLDMIMPKSGGHETFLKLKAIDPDVKVLLSSGFVNESAVEDLLAQGACGFLPKPHRLPVVAKAIRDVLDGKGPVLPGVCNG